MKDHLQIQISAYMPVLYLQIQFRSHTGDIRLLCWMHTSSHIFWTNSSSIIQPQCYLWPKCSVFKYAWHIYKGFDVSSPLFEWQWATMGKKTQIVQDKSEVCMSGSWFISGQSVLACVTCTEYKVLMELMLQTWAVMFWNTGSAQKILKTQAYFIWRFSTEWKIIYGDFWYNKKWVF